jgi:Protein of unknown function (DUF3027)
MPVASGDVLVPDAWLPSDEEHLLNVSTPRTLHARAGSLDETCVAAVDLARCAAEETAGRGLVGPHLAVEGDGDRVVTHLFACLDPGYVGWRWAVTVTRAARAKSVTVSESLLLPGPESLLAPEWVPWRDRVRPGDLGVGDLLPAQSDDERLVPAAVLEGDDGVLDWDDSADWEASSELPGAGAEPVTAAGAADPAQAAPSRARVLSAIGRDMTARRWYSSEHGPGTPLAHAAPGPCATCGFLVRLGGPLGRVFGACANEYAPDDGRVVSLDHGCGAHSEVAGTASSSGTLAPVIDELGYDLAEVAGVSMEETVFESLDHG